MFPLAAAWFLSAWITEAYRHKYPQRYVAYLIAARAKMAVILAILLLVIGGLLGGLDFALDLVLAGGLAMAAEFLLSLPHWSIGSIGSGPDSDSVRGADETVVEPELVEVDPDMIRDRLPANTESAVSGSVVDFILGTIRGAEGELASVEVIAADRVENSGVPVGLMLQLKPLNSMRRLNLFFKDLPSAVAMGGYFVCSYRPLEDELSRLKETSNGLSLWLSYGFHFLWYRALPKIPILERIYFKKPFAFLDDWLYRRAGEKRRVLARAEAWGRMAFWGFEVLAEEKIGDDHWVVTRRVRDPEKARKPSFFLVARLTKVGLDGQPLPLHKLRTMYPFSEFVQEKIFKDHGLSETGKFKNDFRLTDYGRFLRRYWLDEIPQIFDWLRGDIKLVGMRATSPHFLSLYPQELYDLYIQTKPGLIPPIFDAGTSGFDDIVRIELEYLNAYRRRPVVTDVRYFFKTFNDILIRGVRSK